MESLVLILGFIIVFGGTSYVVVDILKHFDKKVYH